MTKRIGKVVATEKAPTTVDEFYFWTDKKLIIKPFDVIKVNHIKGSVTFGVVEEISHLTDSASSLAGFISSDFGDTESEVNTERIGMNYVKARVVGNSQNIYTPVFAVTNRISLVDNVGGNAVNFAAVQAVFGFFFGR